VPGKLLHGSKRNGSIALRKTMLTSFRSAYDKQDETGPSFGWRWSQKSREGFLRKTDEWFRDLDTHFGMRVGVEREHSAIFHFDKAITDSSIRVLDRKILFRMIGEQSLQAKAVCRAFGSLGHCYQP
jgi:hypothetical protein